MPFFIIKMLGPTIIASFAERGFKWAIKALADMNEKDPHEKNTDDQSNTTKDL